MAEEKKKKKKKSDTRVDSGETVVDIVSEHSSMKKKEKKKKKKREIKDGFAGEDGEIGGRESEKLGEDDVVKKKKKKSKEQRIDSEAENDGKKKEKMADSEPELEDGVKKKSKKKHKETKVDSEADDGKKRKKESGSDVIENSESSKFDEKPIVDTDYANKKKGKRKRDDCDLGAQENTDKEMKRKSKKKKESVDSEVKESNEDSDSMKDVVKEKKKKKKKHIVDSEVEDSNLNSTKDAKKKSKEKKQSEDSEAEENNGKDAERKRKKQESGESDKDVTTPSSSQSTKKVKFSDQLKTFLFPVEDEETEDEEEEGKLVWGERYTEEEDAKVKQAVLDYVDNHALGDKGVDMVMKCKSYPQLKGCWKEIAAAIPWRPYVSVYNRAHSIFEAGSKGVWTKEDYELLSELQKKHGNDYRTMGDAMGKDRKHVKDACRRLRLALKNKGSWTREEYQNLFDLVNKDIRTKVFQEKHSKHGMLKDNIPWMAVSDELKTRDHVTCCHKWYEQLTSPMVAKGIWANVDDYRLVEELLKLDAACIDDVDWDYLLENRDGDACRKRWNQMVLHIGLPGSKTFAEQVEILSERYRPELAEDREDFDNRPYDPED